MNLVLVDNKTDNILDPEKGYYQSFYGEFAGWILGGNENYLKNEYKFHKYGIISKPFNLAWRIKFGAITDLESDGLISADKKFSLGGSKQLSRIICRYQGNKQLQWLLHGAFLY